MPAACRCPRSRFSAAAPTPDGGVDIQDFLVVCPGAESFAQALDWTAEVYRTAGKLMAEAGKLKGVADEGGFWPDFAANEEALDYLTRAIERAGFRPVRAGGDRARHRGVRARPRGPLPPGPGTARARPPTA